MKPLLNLEMNISFRTRIQAEKMIPRPGNNISSDKIDRILPV